jgi:hypothetical protein
MSRLAVLAVLAAACAAVPATAQTLKPGLWEIQQKVGGNPQMDQAMAEMQKQLAAMPPEQRKQMEAMMAGRGVQVAPGAGGAMAVKVCMTREMVERNEVPATQGDCKTTQQSRSGSTLTMAFTCSKPPSKGEAQITMVGSDAFTSKTTVTSTEAGKAPATTTIEGTGKWQGADCGSVQPGQPPKN